MEHLSRQVLRSSIFCGKGVLEWPGLFALSFRDRYPFLRARLDRFINYCRAVSGETARFIKNPAALTSISRTMEQREELVRSLAAALEQVQLAAESNS